MNPIIDNATDGWEQSQSVDLEQIPVNERDLTIISAIKVEGAWVITSRFGDSKWRLHGFPSNVPYHAREVDFNRIPIDFQSVIKSILFRYMRRGLPGQKRPVASTVRNLFENLLPFIQYLNSIKITSLSCASTLACTTYIQTCRSIIQTSRYKGKPLSASSLTRRFAAVEALYELSQHTADPMPRHPWPNGSAASIAKGSSASGDTRSGKTPIIPDDVFCALFSAAHENITKGSWLLDLRDELSSIELSLQHQVFRMTQVAQNRRLAERGWVGGLVTFNSALLDLRTSCYILLASVSGCRNHELANLQIGSRHSTEGDDGTVYHWLRTKTQKTKSGIHDWMVPEIALTTHALLERWAVPYQQRILAEIEQRIAINPADPLIAEALQHKGSLFLGTQSDSIRVIRTLTGSTWNEHLKIFSKRAGLSWNLATHQFRRKFANYAAHSRFGDLRYLRQHFTHWSMNMTLGYAMDHEWGQHFDLDLFDEIESELGNIKTETVNHWLESDSLSGGYGHALRRWKRDPDNLTLFKDHSSMVKAIAESTSIRSNGHAWCTADDDRCVGNSTERTRCGGCASSVVGAQHANVYSSAASQLIQLIQYDDIGEGGQRRVLRDLERCQTVLKDLGYTQE
ncbi:Site-specific recombinase, phage integrase family [Pseudomonas coronafaciens pv. atropurpurea]|nr:Site-specific recombinase, phage integrase family [Pseudomonas coronafaciens pv. atropurpurea]